MSLKDNNEGKISNRTISYYIQTALGYFKVIFQPCGWRQSLTIMSRSYLCWSKPTFCMQLLLVIVVNTMPLKDLEKALFCVKTLHVALFPIKELISLQR